MHKMLEYFHKKGSRYVRGDSKSYTDFRKNAKLEGFVCMMLQNPAAEEINALCKDFKLQEKPLNRFKEETRSIRYNYNPLTFTFVDYYVINNNIRVTHVLFIVKSNFLLMITSEHSNYYIELFDRVVKLAQEKKKYSIGYILYEFLHMDARDNYDVLECMDDRIEALEDKVVSDIHEKTVTHDILALKKELIKMSKRFWSSSKILSIIKKEFVSVKLMREEMTLMDDVYDTLMHQIDLIETQKETVTDYLEIFTTTISNRLAATSNELNVVMKKMTALTIIIMVPTLIAGIYGMNYKYMPELGWKYGYAFALLLMLGAIVVLYNVFHSRKWI
ncbi:MAG: magnesium transporter CorA family protein [Candidatus Woesearchaeota archaeon]